MIKSRPRYPIVMVLAALLAAALPGCRLTKQTNVSQVSFDFVLPEGWEVINAEYGGRVARMDTDGDNENEWVILYSFDEPGNQAFAPVGCAIYDTVRREPKLPIIYPYQLQAPGWDYLGERGGGVSVSVNDVVTNIRVDEQDIQWAVNEVIVHGTDVRGGVKRVSIFQWRYRHKPELLDRVEPHEVLIVPGQPIASGEWYECIGRFEGTLDVSVGVNEVTVRDQVRDRSQLARVFVYHASGGAGGYLDRNQELISPTTVCLDLAADVPVDVAQSPYPEKVVLAFLKSYGVTPSQGQNLLTDEAEFRWSSDPTLRALFPPAAPLVPGLCVKAVSYNPQAVIESEVGSFAVAEEQKITDYQVRAQPEIETQATLSTTPIVVPIRARVVTAVVTTPGKEPVAIEWRLIQQGKTWQIEDIIVGSNP